MHWNLPPPWTMLKELQECYSGASLTYKVLKFSPKKVDLFPARVYSRLLQSQITWPPFLGPLGPLVIPLVDLPARRLWITYVQAYVPYESSEVSSNQPDGVRKSSVLSSVLSWSSLDHESESRINSQTFLGQFVLVYFSFTPLLA